MDYRDNNYSGDSLSSSSYQNKSSVCLVDSVPSPTLTQTQRNAELYYCEDEINAEELTCNERMPNKHGYQKTRIRDSDFGNQNYIKNTEDKNVYETYSNDTKRDHLTKSGCACFVQRNGCTPINMCNCKIPRIPAQYSYNICDGTIKEVDYELQEDTPRHTWTKRKKKYSPGNDMKSDFEEKMTYCRPISGCYNQEYVFKTLENKKKLQLLVKKMAAAAKEKEQRKAAWDQYIKQLKLKHERIDTLQQPTTSKAHHTSNKRITSDTLEDYYNTKFNPDFSNNCKSLLNDIYSHSTTIEADNISLPLLNKLINKYHTDMYSNSQEKSHYTCIPAQPNIKIPLETKHYAKKPVESKKKHSRHVYKFNPYIGLPTLPQGYVQRPYLCYPTSSGQHKQSIARPWLHNCNKHTYSHELSRKLQQNMNEIKSNVCHRNSFKGSLSKSRTSNISKSRIRFIPRSQCSNSSKSDREHKTRVTYKKDAETQQISKIHIIDSELKESGYRNNDSSFKHHDNQSVHSDKKALKNIEQKLDVLLSQIHLLLNKNSNVSARNSGGIKQSKKTSSLSRTESRYMSKQSDRKDNDTSNEITSERIIDTKHDEESKRSSKLDPKAVQSIETLEKKIEAIMSEVEKSAGIINKEDQSLLVEPAMIARNSGGIKQLTTSSISRNESRYMSRQSDRKDNDASKEMTSWRIIDTTHDEVSKRSSKVDPKAVQSKETLEQKIEAIMSDVAKSDGTINKEEQPLLVEPAMIARNSDGIKQLKTTSSISRTVSRYMSRQLDRKDNDASNEMTSGRTIDTKHDDLSKRSSKLDPKAVQSKETLEQKIEAIMSDVAKSDGTINKEEQSILVKPAIHEFSSNAYVNDFTSTGTINQKDESLSVQTFMKEILPNGYNINSIMVNNVRPSSDCRPEQPSSAFSATERLRFTPAEAATSGGLLAQNRNKYLADATTSDSIEMNKSKIHSNTLNNVRPSSDCRPEPTFSTFSPTEQRLYFNSAEAATSGALLAQNRNKSLADATTSDSFDLNKSKIHSNILNKVHPSSDCRTEQTSGATEQLRFNSAETATSGSLLAQKHNESLADATTSDSFNSNKPNIHSNTLNNVRPSSVCRPEQTSGATETPLRFTSAEAATSGSLLAQNRNKSLADATTSDSFNLNKYKMHSNTLNKVCASIDCHPEQTSGAYSASEKLFRCTLAEAATSGSLVAQNLNTPLADATTSDSFNLNKSSREIRHENHEVIQITGGHIYGQTKTTGYIIDLKDISGQAAIAGIILDQKCNQVSKDAATSGGCLYNKAKEMSSTEIAYKESFCKKTDFLNLSAPYSRTFSVDIPIERDAEDGRRNDADNISTWGMASAESNLTYTKGQMYLIKKSTTNFNSSKIDEILIEEMDKSDRAKRDIEDILNGERTRNYGVQMTLEVPTKECCTEISRSLSISKTINEESLDSMSYFPEQLQRTNKRLTIAVNTDPISFLTLLKISTATITRFLSYMIFDYHAFLPRPRLISNQVVRPLMKFDCNLCGTSFVRASQLSNHVRSNDEGNSRDCCVCRHLVNRTCGGYSAPFRCRYCGKGFTRAYCRELHESDCAKKRGVQHDIPENLAILT